MNDFLKNFYWALNEVRDKNPIVHSITNFVSMNDCANVCTAFGGSPIMAFCSDEVEEVTTIADSLVLNIGTPDKDRFEAIKISGKKANEKGIPIIFDPVGVGVSQFRKNGVRHILDRVKVSIIKGNVSEIKFITGIVPNMNKGVDAVDILDESNFEMVKKLAKELNCVVAVTGKEDYITDGRRYLKIKRGSQFLKKVSGTGCMTSQLMACFSDVESDMFLVAVYGILTMNLCGEIAEKNLKDGEGICKFKINLLDAISNLHKTCIEDMEGIEFGI